MLAADRRRRHQHQDHHGALAEAHPGHDEGDPAGTFRGATESIVTLSSWGEGNERGGPKSLTGSFPVTFAPPEVGGSDGGSSGRVVAYADVLVVPTEVRWPTALTSLESRPA